MVVARGGAETLDGGERRLGVDWQGWVACAAAVSGFVLCLVGWLAGRGSVSLPWAPSLGLRLDFALDGLAVLYGLLATGVGALVFAYGTRYLTLHLEHERRSAMERWRFWPWMVLFAVAIGTAVLPAGAGLLLRRRGGARPAVLHRHRGDGPLPRLRGPFG